MREYFSLAAHTECKNQLSHKKINLEAYNLENDAPPSRSRVMMLGLDGAPWALLRYWISKNKLQAFKKIMNLGSTGILKSTIPCTTFPAVPSLFTGMNPGNLGIFSFLKSDGSPLTMRDSEYDKIWNILDIYDRKSCVVNVPLSYPPEKVCGIMISGWTPHMKYDYTYPEELKEETKGFFDYKIEKEKFNLREKKRNEKDRKKLVNLLIEITERRYNIFKKLNEKQEYDFSIWWLEHTDFLQHCCWEYKETLLQLYIKIDDILNDILLNFPDRNIFIVSDHGFESRPDRFFFVNSWLHKQGYLYQRGGLINYFVNFGQFFAYNNLRINLLSKILARWQSMKNKGDSSLRTESFDIFPGIDLKNSKAYLNTMFGINVKEGSDYEVIRNEIIEKLRRTKDEKGDSVIRNIWKKEDIFTGKYLKEIPDIIFLTSKRYVPFPALTKNLFRETHRTKYWWQSGEHYRARDGILLACGPDIKKNKKLVNANIEDIFPTVLHLMGHAIPKHVDGKVITEIFMIDRKPIIENMCKEHEGLLASEEIYKMEKEDEEKIIDRLKKLGYIY